MYKYGNFRHLKIVQIRNARSVVSLSSQSTPSKPTGDISSVFPSLSGAVSPPLPSRFADLKSRLIRGHEDDLQGSWNRLLSELQREIKVVKLLGSNIVPEISFANLDNEQKRVTFGKELQKRGVAVIRHVVTEREALDWKELAKRYIESNPSTKGFPPEKPAVYELYWSPSQILARAHPNLLRTQAFLMSHWHSAETSALISTANPTSYADRVRIRQPGDAGFALGPHVDGGGCERWEENGYGLGGVYKHIFDGAWEKYDPWESSCRLRVVSDLYNGAGACSMFRMFQGWLSMSTTGPGEGTLKVNPLLEKATAYILLRPFFAPQRSVEEASEADFLNPNNWAMEIEPTPTLQGAVPSNCQELNSILHPHLDLDNTMVHIPTVGPGDYVAWHCDTIHAVDKTHTGNSDSSVLYIPACPLTEANAAYLVRQRDTMSKGIPPPDFPSGPGESQHVGGISAHLRDVVMGVGGRRAMGVERFEEGKEEGEGAEMMVKRANGILGFGGGVG